MKINNRQNLLVATLVGVLACAATIARAADPLPSWNDGQARQVAAVITQLEVQRSRLLNVFSQFGHLKQ